MKRDAVPHATLWMDRERSRTHEAACEMAGVGEALGTESRPAASRAWGQGGRGVTLMDAALLCQGDGQTLDVDNAGDTVNTLKPTDLHAWKGGVYGVSVRSGQSCCVREGNACCGVRACTGPRLPGQGGLQDSDHGGGGAPAS